MTAYFGVCGTRTPPCVKQALYRLIATVGVVGLTAAPAASETRDVTIRVYDMLGVARGELEVATRTARQILDRAGLNSVWRICPPLGKAAAPGADTCEDDLQRNELIVRVLAAPSGTPEETLGCSNVDTRAKAGTLASVFADRIANLATSAGFDEGTLLGRAVAHEVGHILMGTTAHSTTGLMRATWQGASLRQEGAHWIFTRPEAAAMRRALIARTAPPPSLLASLRR